jgi:mRNA interferase RelE/StbE
MQDETDAPSMGQLATNPRIAIFIARHELAWAGAASAAFLIGAALAGPYKGKLVDRYGASRLNLPMATLFTLAAAAGGVLAIPPRYAAAIIEFVYGVLAENPHRLGKPLERELAGTHSARRGDYRVIYEIHQDNDDILIVRIDHRSRVYRPHHPTSVNPDCQVAPGGGSVHGPARRGHSRPLWVRALNSKGARVGIRGTR